MNKLMLWAARKWAGKAVSNILMGVIVLGLMTGYGYVKNLQVKAARCEASESVIENNKQLVERLEERLEEDDSEAIEDIKNANHPCLDVTLDELLNSADTSD